MYDRSPLYLLNQLQIQDQGPREAESCRLLPTFGGMNWIDVFIRNEYKQVLTESVERDGNTV